MRNNRLAKDVAYGLFAFFTIWIILIHLFVPKDTDLYINYGLTYGVIALWGGIWGIIVARLWGGLKSIIGKAITMFALGLFSQVFGQLAFSYYYLIEHIDVPYPSIADIGFFGTIPFYIYGAYLLSQAAGVSITLSSLKNKIQAIIIPSIMVGVAYVLFLRHYQMDPNDPLGTFLNFAYPLGQAIYISIGILTYSLTRSILGGVMKKRILFFIFAFSAQFFADYYFIFDQNHYYPGGIHDYIYAIAYFLMTLAILQMVDVWDKLRREEK
jgi:hypothetical protein